MLAYSVDPSEAFLSTKGIETIKSNLAQEIFRQDLLQIYQKQTDLRDELRQESRDRIVQIVGEINSGEYENPQMQMMFIQLADRLAKAKGKKQYGYLNAGTKKLVDAIVTELAGDSRIQELYGVGKQYLKTEVQKAISMFELAAEQGNAYAEYQLGKIYCFGQGVPQNLGVGMEWLKASANHGNEYASALLEKVQNHIHQQTTSAVFRLFRGLAGMIQASANQHIRRRDSIDRKLRQNIEEKKQAHGQRSSDYEYDYEYDYSEGQTM